MTDRAPRPELWEKTAPPFNDAAVPSDFHAGQRVEIVWPNGPHFGTVVKVWGGGVRVRPEDGGKTQTWNPRELWPVR